MEIIMYYFQQVDEYVEDIFYGMGGNQPSSPPWRAFDRLCPKPESILYPQEDSSAVCWQKLCSNFQPSSSCQTIFFIYHYAKGRSSGKHIFCFCSNISYPKIFRILYNFFLLYTELFLSHLSFKFKVYILFDRFY